MCTAPRVTRNRYGCVGTTVVAGLVKSLKTGYDNDVRSKIVGVEPKKTEKGSGDKKGAKAATRKPRAVAVYKAYPTATT